MKNIAFRANRILGRETSRIPDSECEFGWLAPAVFSLRIRNPTGSLYRNKGSQAKQTASVCCPVTDRPQPRGVPRRYRTAVCGRGRTPQPCVCRVYGSPAPFHLTPFIPTTGLLWSTTPPLPLVDRLPGHHNLFFVPQSFFFF